MTSESILAVSGWGVDERGATPNVPRRPPPVTERGTPDVEVLAVLAERAGCQTTGVDMSELTVTRLLANPLGQVAPPGHRGDIVCVGDGTAKVYLDPTEFERLTEGAVRTLLAEAAAPKRTRPPARPTARPVNAPTLSSGSSRGATPRTGTPRVPAAKTATSAQATAADAAVRGQPAAGSVTDPRHARRRAQPLW